MQLWKAIAVLLALQALTYFTAARHMPLRQPEHADARGIAATRGGQQSAEVEGRDGQSVQPHTTTRHRKLLQGAMISRLAAEYDGTETADGQQLCKTNDCLWRQNNDAIKFAGILGGMVMGAFSLCCGCIYCTLKLCGRNDDLETDMTQLSEVRVTSEMWAHHCKKARSPAPTKPAQKRLPPERAAEKITVVVEANTLPATVPAEAITIVIDSSTAEEDAVEYSSTRESTVEKCGVQEDVAEQSPGEKGGGSCTVVSCSVEQSSAAEATAEQSSAPEATVEESSAEEGPVGRSSIVHPEHCNAEEGIAESCSADDGAVEEHS